MTKLRERNKYFYARPICSATKLQISLQFKIEKSLHAKCAQYVNQKVNFRGCPFFSKKMRKSDFHVTVCEIGM